MVVAIAVSAVSAADDIAPIDGRELQEYGQIHYWLGDAVEATAIPNAKDGTISENEYAVSYQYGPDSPRSVAKVTDSATGSYTDTEWVKVYLSHDGENLYIGMEMKDKAYYADKDYFFINIGARDGGRTIEGVSRIRYDFRGDATTLIEGEGVQTAVGTMWKNDDGSWGTMTKPDINDHAGDRSMLWHADEGILTFEVVFKIQPILDSWENELDIEDARFYFIPLVKMRGDSAEGAGDGPLDQGYLWHYLDSNENPNLRMNFTISYPEISYWMEFFPHIIHFCEAPEETTVVTTEPPATTTTEKATMPTIPATTTVAPTDAPTDAPKADATTKAAEKEKGCGSTVALSALAIVPMLGAAVVFGKKKED